MNDKSSLKELFDSNKSELERKLNGLLLPKDNKQIQRVISDYLSTLIDSEGEYRQNLTQTEDYLLQATLSLLTAQQNMCSALISQEIKAQIRSINDETQNKNDNIEEPQLKAGDGNNGKRFKDYVNTSISATNATIGSVTGALVGNLVFGGWGAVFGSIAGTAVMVYIAGLGKRNAVTLKQNQKSLLIKPEVEIVYEPINVDKFIEIVGGICDSVDNLISTFRAQVNRVINKYESMEKPTIEKQYGFLLESIQTLIGYKRAHNPEDVKYIKKIQGRIEDLAECLENYNLTTEDYNGENDYLFEIIQSTESLEVKTAYPAIVKDGVAVLKGKVFMPSNSTK